MATSRSDSPTMSTLPTPEMFSRRRLTFLSTSVVSAWGDSFSERMATDTMGTAAKSSLLMMGSSIPWGRSPRMAPILDRASCEASLILTPSSNSTTTVETPSRDVDVTCLTPEMGLTASSIRLVTSRSTVSGDAPGNTVTMDRTGISTSGNMSMASRRYEKMPKVTRASIMTAANTGRLMDRLDSSIGPLLFSGRPGCGRRPSG